MIEPLARVMSRVRATLLRPQPTRPVGRWCTHQRNWERKVDLNNADHDACARAPDGAPRRAQECPWHAPTLATMVGW